MPAIKTTILFDRFSIPVSMYKATVDTDLPLHEYHIGDMRRVSRKAICSGCGIDLTAEDVSKGFETDGDVPVLLTKAEIRQLKLESDNTVTVLYSTSPEMISPVYIDASYMAAPVPGNEGIFEAFRTALTVMKKAAIGKAILGGYDSPAAILPAEERLLIVKLRFENDIAHFDKAPERQPAPKLEKEELAHLLLDMDAPFDLSSFENDYQNNLRRLITTKINANRENGPQGLT
jgi:DNA end-binding protein Ku